MGWRRVSLRRAIRYLQRQTNTKKKNASNEVLFWMGYVYRYWHFYTKESSARIYRQASFETMSVNYLMFHTMDVEMAIDNLKEIYNQKK